MAVTLVGKGHIYGLATMTFGITSLSGYVTPKFETLSLTNNADFSEEMDQTGNIDAIVCNQRGVQCTFRFKPKGSTVANAKLSAGIPAVGAVVTITGLPVIDFAGFSDVLNSGGTGNNDEPWLFDGNASIEGVHDGVWTANITLRRYKGIDSGTAIT
jgi:hypothetical protein